MSLIIALLITSSCQKMINMDIPPKEIIRKSTERTQTLKGFSFIFDRQGAPAFLDVNQTYSFSHMKGVYVAPDRVQVSTRIITPGVVADIQIICLEGRQWETNIFTGEWMLVPDEYSFNPLILVDPTIGIKSISENVIDLNLDGLEELEAQPGFPLYKLTGKLDGSRISQLSYGLIAEDKMDVAIWIAPDSFDLHRIQFIENAKDPKYEKTWTLDFWDFDKVSKITPPLIP